MELNACSIVSSPVRIPMSALILMHPFDALRCCTPVYSEQFFADWVWSIREAVARKAEAARLEVTFYGGSAFFGFPIEAGHHHGGKWGKTKEYEGIRRCKYISPSQGGGVIFYAGNVFYFLFKIGVIWP